MQTVGSGFGDMDAVGQAIQALRTGSITLFSQGTMIEGSGLEGTHGRLHGDRDANKHSMV